ncbi:MAG: hypothetical protein E6Q34_01195 [Burkholderiaceae bacterium]|nr:MAG: hypothetical protein E6Q34_01195 [Burkholderiaceae bacterium]
MFYGKLFSGNITPKKINFFAVDDASFLQRFAIEMITLLEAHLSENADSTRETLVGNDSKLDGIACFEGGSAGLVERQKLCK